MARILLFNCNKRRKFQQERETEILELNKTRASKLVIFVQE